MQIGMVGPPASSGAAEAPTKLESMPLASRFGPDTIVELSDAARHALQSPSEAGGAEAPEPPREVAAEGQEASARSAAALAYRASSML